MSKIIPLCLLVLEIYVIENTPETPGEGAVMRRLLMV